MASPNGIQPSSSTGPREGAADAAAKLGWEEHRRRERRLRSACAAALVALAAGAGMWWAYLGKAQDHPALTPQQAIDAKAKAALDNPEAALGGRRVGSSPLPLDKEAPKRQMANPGKVPSGGVEMSKPPATLAPIAQVAPLGAPTAEMLARLAAGRPAGQGILAVDADGFATLPNGQRVMVKAAAASPEAQARAEQARVAAVRASQKGFQQREAALLESSKLDGNGNPIPPTLEEVLRARSQGRAVQGAAPRKPSAGSSPGRAPASAPTAPATP